MIVGQIPARGLNTRSHYDNGIQPLGDCAKQLRSIGFGEALLVFGASSKCSGIRSARSWLVPNVG